MLTTWDRQSVIDALLAYRIEEGQWPSTHDLLLRIHSWMPSMGDLDLHFRTFREALTVADAAFARLGLDQLCAQQDQKSRDDGRRAVAAWVSKHREEGIGR